MSVSTKTNLILDLTIFAAVLALANPELTGAAIHEWLGVAFLAALVAHLLFHWRWIVSVTTQFFKKLWHDSRLNYMVNLLFLVLMTGALLSGLMISESVLAFFGIHIERSPVWEGLHHTLSDAAVLVLGLHLALHWKWIVTHLDRYSARPMMESFRRAPRVPAPVMVSIRDSTESEQ